MNRCLSSEITLHHRRSSPTVLVRDERFEEGCFEDGDMRRMAQQQQRTANSNRRRRGSSILCDGLKAIRRSLEDEVVGGSSTSQLEEEGGEEDVSAEWFLASGSDISMSAAEGGDASSSDLLLRSLQLKDRQSDVKFEEGMKLYFSGDDSKACLLLSRCLELRQSIQEHDMAAAMLFESDEGLRRRHDRQLQHCRVVLADMATNPSSFRGLCDNEGNKHDWDATIKTGAKINRAQRKQNDSDDEEDGDSLIEDFMTPSARRLKIPSFSKRHLVDSDIEDDGDDGESGGEDYSLPIRYYYSDGDSADTSSSSDVDFEEPSCERAVSEAGGDIYSTLAKLPESAGLPSKANNATAAFHNSCVSELWDSTACDFAPPAKDGSELLPTAKAEDSDRPRGLQWAAANAGRALAASSAHSQPSQEAQAAAAVGTGRASRRRSSIIMSRAA